ncbi:hypothetical protein Rhal01_02523 [Rubritalea halochordaticola]|uniref:YcxB family protein n=1 Tax=Rubritalea halochordaticola TaxID=714537 RepID=A0ABP9V2X7_9BACT
MTITFQLSEGSALHFTQHFLQTSPAIAKAIQTERIRSFLLSLVFGFLIAVGIDRDNPYPALGFFLVLGIVLAVLQRRIYQHKYLQAAIKRIRSSGIRKNFGTHSITFVEDSVSVQTPLIQSSISWQLVESSTLTADFLYFQLIGQQGYAIPVSQIGQQAAEDVHAFIQSHAGQAATPPALPEAETDH